MNKNRRKSPAQKTEQNRQKAREIKRSSRNEFLLKPSVAFRNAKSYTRKTKHPVNYRNDE